MKHFYNHFKRERAAFQYTVQEHAPATDQSRYEQYTSLILNRLLFLHFLQARELLDNNKHYLLQRLALVQAQQGPDRFYQSFLLPLFHAGFAQPQASTFDHKLFGNIPCLGKDLFSPRDLEAASSGFSIPDRAFKRLFDFFAGYNWYVDEMLTHDDGITPTVLGYLFEQYINQQQMGAYYTKNDVTAYIAQRTIIPSLLDTLVQQCPHGLHIEGTIWQKVRESPDRYIAHAIQCQEYLPTETTREYAERQKQYQEVKRQLAGGQITHIDDLITYNLDVERFAYDTLSTIRDPDLLFAFYQQLQKIKILDPTCGSGAFLFAALRVLLPLYEACLDALSKVSSPALLQLAQPQHGPGRRYFILKSIIVNNLYGIDIMEDAVEVCRLRLLLALFTYVAHIHEIEPISQITHTIQVGNIVTPLSERSSSPAPAASATTQPHPADSCWQVAFKDILSGGGFDIIIGNPPYVEYSEKNLAYRLDAFNTRICANLYTCVVERSRQLLSPHGRHGMILPLAAFSTRNMQPFLDAFRRWFPVSWLSFYHFRPSMLFSGGKVASIATAIYLAKTTGAEQRFSTQLLKWPREQRDLLFSRLIYCQITAPADIHNRHYYCKFGAQQENAIMGKVLKHELVKTYLAQQPNQNTMYYRSAGGLYWKIFVNFVWPYDTTSNKQCSFQPHFDRDIFIALFNSSLFWWYYTVTFDTFNLKDYMLFGFRFSYPQDTALLAALRDHSAQLMADFRSHARHLKRGTTGSYTIYAGKSKAIIDDIDRLLAHHYDLTPAELDFILNYDIKYRMSTHESAALSSARD